MGKRFKFLPWIIWITGAIFYLYEYFLRIAPSVMTTDLMRDFGISAAVLGNMIAFYYYVYTPMQLPVGVLMDRFGPRRLLTFACVACAFGTYLFAGKDIHLAMLGRFFVGFGSAFAFVGVLKIARVWLSPERFGLMSGLAAALGTVGGMTGDISLTALVQHSGWRHTTLMAAGAGLILAVIVYLVIRDCPSDVKGQAEAAPKTTMKSVLTDLKVILKTPQMWLVGLIGCLLYLPTTAFAELWGIPYLEQAHHMTQEQAALAISSLFLGWGVFAPISGWLSDKIKSRCKPMIFGGFIGAILAILLIYVPDIPQWMVYGILFVFGASYSVQVLVFPAGVELCPPTASGTAIAVTNMFVMLGGVIFQPVIGILLDVFWSGKMALGVHVYSTEAYQNALLVLPIALVIAGILTLVLKESYHGDLLDADVKV